jgi:hypothetical protein
VVDNDHVSAAPNMVDASKTPGWGRGRKAVGAANPGAKGPSSRLPEVGNYGGVHIFATK